MPLYSNFSLLEEGYEPSAEEIFHIIDSVYETYDIGSMGENDKGITFCGAGDPLLKYDILIDCVKKVKECRHGIQFSITTSGLFDTNIPLLLKESGIKNICINLNAADPVTYMTIMKPNNNKTFSDVCNFICNAADTGMNVTCAAVEKPGIDMKEVRKLALSLGAMEFKVRPYFE